MYTRRTRMGMEKLISRSSASSGWPSGERARSDHIVTGIYLGWFFTFHFSWFCILADFVLKLILCFSWFCISYFSSCCILYRGWFCVSYLTWFCILYLAVVVFHKKEEQEIREEFLKLDTDRSGFITKGERFKMCRMILSSFQRRCWLSSLVVNTSMETRGVKNFCQSRSSNIHSIFQHPHSKNLR